MVIWSASLKPSRRLPKVVAQRTMASRTMSATMTTAMSVSEKGPPQALDHGGREGEVDDHQDRAAVDGHQELLLGMGSVADPGLQRLAEDEGEQQLRESATGHSRRSRRGPPTEKSRPTRSGVRNMPKILEAEAEQIAASVPPAIEVKAIGDCTVDGRTQRKRMPKIERARQDQIRHGPSVMPSSGKMAKVVSRITRCSRQCNEAGDDDIARQARAVQEEEERDGKRRRRAEIAREGAAGRKDRGQDDSADQKDGEGIGQETRRMG